MSRIANVITGLLLFWVAESVFASSLVIHDDTVLNRYPISRQIAAYNGDTSPATIDAATGLPDSAYGVVGSSYPLRLMQTRWFRLSITNSSSKSRSLVFDFDQALYSRIEWRSTVGGQSKEIVTGQSYPYASRDIDYNYFAFRLDVPPGETLVVNFSIYTPYAALFVPTLTDSELFLKALPQEWQLSGAVFGMLYAVVFCLLIYIVLMPRSGVALALLGQVTFSMLSILYLTGVIQGWLPDTVSRWRDIAHTLIHTGQGICYSLAVVGFFQARVNYPVLNKILLSLVVVALISVAMLPFFALDYILVSTFAINFCMMAFATILAVLSLVRRQEGTALFAIGLVLFVVLTAVAMLGFAGVPLPSVLTRYSYEMGLTIQADIMFAAIAFRMFTMERDKLNVQKEMLRLETEMKVRSEFVDRVTHDIKSPLSAVLGAEQLLRTVQDDSKRDSYLNVIRASCGMVINIVDNILGHARITSSGVALNCQSFSLRDVLREMEESVNASLRSGPVALQVSVSEEIPEMLYGDKVRVSQLITNLVTNAFKFTDEGRVRVSVDLLEKTDRKVNVRLVVQDTGIGMSEAFLQRAFEPYAREENREDYRPGFGLGLSICKEIVELMGGSIDVLSAVGQGSRFTVIIPFQLHE